jgi:protein-L-isoaspartate(D-aspartate) O-methyltransferase
MVERQLRRRGIGDERVLGAMAAVPRELFVPQRHRPRAYFDGALPIGHDQTISQPWIVAAICQGLALDGDEVVLEVGTGSGYSACVLSHLCRSVISIERIPELAERAAATLAELAAANVEVVLADGSEGLPDRAPFDGIAVHATAPAAPQALLRQLARGGRLVAPIAGRWADTLTVFIRTGEHVDPETGVGLERISLGPSRFVPLVGREGFDPDRLG